MLGARGLAGQGVVLVFEQVTAGKEGDEVAVGIDDRELSLLGIAQDGVGLVKGDARLANDKVRLLRHDRLERSLRLAELDVTTSDNTDELAAKLAGLGDRNTAEAQALLDVKDTDELVVAPRERRHYSLANLALGTQDNGVGDETVLELLDAVHHSSLFFGGAVVVDDTETTVKSKSNSHAKDR